MAAFRSKPLFISSVELRDNDYFDFDLTDLLYHGKILIFSVKLFDPTLFYYGEEEGIDNWNLWG